MAERYIVCTDGPALVSSQGAKLYRLTGYSHRAELAASGSLGQMQALADELNATGDTGGTASRREPECSHEAWESTGTARRCADCGAYLGERPERAALADELNAKEDS